MFDVILWLLYYPYYLSIYTWEGFYNKIAGNLIYRLPNDYSLEPENCRLTVMFRMLCIINK